MFTWILNAKPYLEAASFAANVILAMGLAVAAGQLFAFSKDAKTRNIRLAKEKAIEAMTRCLTTFVEKAKNDYDYRRSINLKIPNLPIGDFKQSSVREFLNEKNLNYLFNNSTLLPALNELEVIAAYFVTGVADESTGFQIIGRTFCGSVEIYYPYIAFLRGDEPAAPFWQNIVSLQKIWSVRLTREELKASADALSHRLSTLPVDNVEKPIGC